MVRNDTGYDSDAGQQLPKSTLRILYMMMVGGMNISNS